jgi:hypothetical protein
MRRFRNANPHQAQFDVRDAQARRHAVLRLTALAERDAAKALADFGFHRNRVAERGRAAKRLSRLCGLRSSPKPAACTRRDSRYPIAGRVGSRAQGRRGGSISTLP